jgi:hypothetical protein
MTPEVRQRIVKMKKDAEHLKGLPPNHPRVMTFLEQGGPENVMWMADRLLSDSPPPASDEQKELDNSATALRNVAVEVLQQELKSCESVLDELCDILDVASHDDITFELRQRLGMEQVDYNEEYDEEDEE